MHVLFVDDEANVLAGLKRMLFDMRGEWRMTFVESGARALEVMGAAPVDVIVSDMRMPGMDGATLLAHVAQRHPQCVRVLLSGYSAAQGMLRSVTTAHQFLAKPCDPKTLRDAIGRARAVRDLTDNPRLKRIVSGLANVPTLPQLHRELLAELDAEEPSLARIAIIIERDIGMTAKVMQLANSAFFGLRIPVNSTRDAVVMLGLNVVRTLALSVQAFTVHGTDARGGLDVHALWRHSLAVADIASRAATQAGLARPIREQALLAGMLHDVGRLVLANGFGEAHARLLASETSGALALCDAERVEFGHTHAEVGACLLSLWGLPAALVQAVAFHHVPSDCPGDPVLPVALVHLADAHAHGVATTGDGVSSWLDREYVEAAGLGALIDERGWAESGPHEPEAQCA